jgi:hypothetical protein
MRGCRGAGPGIEKGTAERSRGSCSGRTPAYAWARVDKGGVRACGRGGAGGSVVVPVVGHLDGQGGLGVGWRRTLQGL